MEARFSRVVFCFLVKSRVAEGKVEILPVAALGALSSPESHSCISLAIVPISSFETFAIKIPFFTIKKNMY